VAPDAGGTPVAGATAPGSVAVEGVAEVLVGAGAAVVSVAPGTLEVVAAGSAVVSVPEELLELESDERRRNATPTPSTPMIATATSGLLLSDFLIAYPFAR
jgi:hypothetical protein